MKINAFNNLFSITNMPSKDNKWYKVFRIFGIKFSFRNKKKENKLKYENYYKFKNCPVEQRPKMLKEWYFNCTGEVLNLENPQTFSEKIQWLKLYDSTPLKTRLADKYLVCDWVKEKIGEEYLIPLLGVWDKFEDFLIKNKDVFRYIPIHLQSKQSKTLNLPNRTLINIDQNTWELSENNRQFNIELLKKALNEVASK